MKKIISADIKRFLTVDERNSIRNRIYDLLESDKFRNRSTFKKNFPFRYVLPHMLDDSALCMARTLGADMFPDYPRYVNFYCIEFISTEKEWEYIEATEWR